MRTLLSKNLTLPLIGMPARASSYPLLATDPITSVFQALQSDATTEGAKRSCESIVGDYAKRMQTEAHHAHLNLIERAGSMLERFGQFTHEDGMFYGRAVRAESAVMTEHVQPNAPSNERARRKCRVSG